MNNNDDRDMMTTVCPFCNQQIAQRPPFGPPGTPARPPFGPPGSPARPPFGPPSGPPTQPPFGPPFGPPSQPPVDTRPGQRPSGPPSGPPPSFIPQQTQRRGPGGISPLRVDPGAIRPCIFRFVYIWENSGRQYWAWLVFVGRNSAAGWRWNGRRWVYFGIDLDRISSFTCF